MSDRLFFALSALVAIGLIALAFVWPPRATTGLDEAPAEAVAPSMEGEATAPEAPAAAEAGS